MTRKFTAGLTIVLILLVIMFDSTQSSLNPYDAPSAFALGSGERSGGAFCGELPD